MNIYARSSIFTLFIFLFITQACKKSPEINPYNEEFVKVNSWVTENMRYWYYWNKEIPGNEDLNLNLNPKDFFESILSEDDRFSWIDDVDKLNEDLAGVSTTTGLNFGLVQDGNAVIGYVRYVIPGSSAELANIERGMFFTKVNGKAMTVSNYNSVLDPHFKGEGFKVQLAELVGNEFKPVKEVQLAASKVNEPSVYFHKIINTNAGKKVGYLFYNRFLNDDTESLFEAFQDFKANEIDDLILDIRYNLGGGIAVSGLLSALIMKDFDENDVYVEYRYNDNLNEFFDAEDSDYRKEKFKSVITAKWESELATAKLNLGKVYVLATYNSDSASELIINNLRPYMDVVHIGEMTRGKNEGSTTIEDTRNPRQINWAIQPIILKLANADGFGDYDKGLDPTIEVREGYELRPFGDLSDPLVKAALSHIGSGMVARSRVTPPGVLNMFKTLKSFDKINNKARPVLVDKARSDKVGILY
ncbi:MAG TPA: S41 family peptidase [Sphingobacteriaceae bacterium]|nr:S41 family peptidase [Sphingobacteriaceae bacterium]